MDESMRSAVGQLENPLIYVILRYTEEFAPSHSVTLKDVASKAHHSNSNPIKHEKLNYLSSSTRSYFVWICLINFEYQSAFFDLQLCTAGAPHAVPSTCDCSRGDGGRPCGVGMPNGQYFIPPTWVCLRLCFVFFQITPFFIWDLIFWRFCVFCPGDWKTNPFHVYTMYNIPTVGLLLWPTVGK